MSAAGPEEDTVLAIDPGEHQGWAYFRSCRLEVCGLGPPTYDLPLRTCVVERPHSHRTKARVRDILTLALRAGEAGGRYGIELCADLQYVEPSTWKGAVTKEVSHRRIRAKLDERELERLDRALRKVAASKQHNVLDAVGIGLWAVGR